MKRILPVLALALFAVACGSSSKSNNSANNGDQGAGGDNGTGTTDPGTGGTTDPGTVGNGGGDADLANTNPIEGTGDVTALSEPGAWTDGPTWSPQAKALYFTTPLQTASSNPPAGLFRMLTDGRAIQTRGGDDANFTTPIGTTVLASGEIVTAEYKQITKTTSDAIVNAPDTVISTKYDPNSSPKQTDPYAPPPPPAGDGNFDTLNDVVARKDGTLYVTDPGYKVPGAGPAVNRIYRVDTAGNTTIVDAFEDIPHPNGIALSPDEKVLYVGFSSPTQGTAPYIRKYTVNDDGTIGAYTKYIDLGADSAPDGLGVDKAGNVYVATTAGIEVYKPSGEKWGVVAVPEIPTGLTFGGDTGNTMFITTQATHIFQLTTKVPGLSQ